MAEATPARTGMAFGLQDGLPAMAKGDPARQDSTALPECAACGSGRFREAHGALRCEDCHALLHDPFSAP